MTFELLVERLQQLAVDRLAQVDALEQLHRHVEEALLLPEVVHGDDVGVVEQGRRLGLALEALQGLVVGAEAGGERLEGDEAVQHGVVGLVDLAHRAAAELADDRVLADPLAIHAVICRPRGQQTMVARYFPAISSRISEIGIMPAAFSSSMKPPSVKRRAERARALGQQRLDHRLAGEVAGAVAGLLQVEPLLEPDGVAIRAQPAARRPLAGEARRLVERPLVRVHAQARDRARGALGQHDVDELAAPGPLRVEPRAHRQLLHPGREALGAAVPDVVEQRHRGGSGSGAARAACARGRTSGCRGSAAAAARARPPREKKSRLLGRHEAAEPRPQRRLVVVRHRHDLLLAQEAHVVRERRVGARLPLGGASRPARAAAARGSCAPRAPGCATARASSRCISTSSSCQV